MLSLSRMITMQIVGSKKKTDKKKIKQCARLCKYIYKSPYDVLINETKNDLFITIEGTDTLSNWIDNMSIGLKKNDIHKGFFRYSTSCIRNYDLIKTIKENDKPLYICGHSLGAAAATVIVFKLAFLLKDKECNLVLFGSPKPGGTSFSRKFIETLPNVKIYNYQNHRDIVCKLPCLLGYSHLNEDIYFIEYMYIFFFVLKNHDMDTYIDGI